MPTRAAVAENPSRAAYTSHLFPHSSGSCTPRSRAQWRWSLRPLPWLRRHLLPSPHLVIPLPHLCPHVPLRTQVLVDKATLVTPLSHGSLQTHVQMPTHLQSWAGGPQHRS